MPTITQRLFEFLFPDKAEQLNGLEKSLDAYSVYTERYGRVPFVNDNCVAFAMHYKRTSERQYIALYTPDTVANKINDSPKQFLLIANTITSRRNG